MSESNRLCGFPATALQAAPAPCELSVSQPKVLVLEPQYRSTSYFSDCCLKCNFRIQSAILHCRCPSMPSVARCCFFGQFRPTRAPAACDFLFSLSFSFRVPCNRKAPRILSFSWRILGAFRVPKTRTGSSSLRTPRSFRSMSFYLTFTIAEPPWRLARRNRVPA